MLLWIAVTCWVCRYDCSHWIFKGQEQLILPFLFHFILLPSPLQVGFCWKQWLRYGWSSVRAYDLPGSSQPQCNGVSHPLSCLEACCDFLVLKEFCPIPPVGWPGLEDFPLVQWLSDPVRYWPETALQGRTWATLSSVWAPVPHVSFLGCVLILSLHS